MQLTPFRSSMAAMLLVALSVTPSFAQGGRRGGGPGGPGGMGMMGGMRGGGDLALLGLMRVEEVQKEIDMMPDQVAALDKLSESLRGERPDFRAIRDASEDERQEMMEKFRKSQEELGKKATEQLEELLLPEQLDRLRQISLQQQGSGAFSDKRVIEKLKITEEQQEKIRERMMELGEEMREEMRELFQSGDREKMGEVMGKMREKQLEEAKKILSSSQRSQFEEMLGKPFEMPQRPMFGGRGGRGGQQGGGRGGRGGRGGSDN